MTGERAALDCDRMGRHDRDSRSAWQARTVRRRQPATEARSGARGEGGGLDPRCRRGSRESASAREAIDAAAKLLVARAHAEVTAEKIAEIVAPVLARHQLKTTPYARRGVERPAEVITDEKHLYLCDDDDACKAYYADRHNAIVAAGFEVEQDYCPACIADTERVDAEVALLKLTDARLGTRFADAWGESRDKALHLLVSVIVAAG